MSATETYELVQAYTSLLMALLGDADKRYLRDQIIHAKQHIERGFPQVDYLYELVKKAQVRDCTLERHTDEFYD